MDGLQTLSIIPASVRKSVSFEKSLHYMRVSRAVSFGLRRRRIVKGASDSPEQPGPAGGSERPLGALIGFFACAFSRKYGK